MFNRRGSKPQSDTSAGTYTGTTWKAIAAQVDSESRPYTDPKALYPVAEQARNAQRQGVQRGQQR